METNFRKIRRFFRQLFCRHAFGWNERLGREDCHYCGKPRP